MKVIIPVVLALLVVVGLAIWKFGPSINKSTPQDTPVTINIWGLWEDDSLLKTTVENYKKAHPNITVNYSHQSSLNYRTRLQTKISNNEGPDIFMIHNSWIPMFVKSDNLSLLPETIMSRVDFATTFYPVAKETLTNYYSIKDAVNVDKSINDKKKAIEEAFLKQGKIYALPLEIDGIAMYYNEDILKAVGLGVPQTWDEFTKTAQRVTVPPPGTAGPIQTAGAALGTTNNVDHWSDIVGMLFLQEPGADLEHPDAVSPNGDNTNPGADVIRFYTNFAKSGQKVWDATMESSTQAFAAGRVAFYFAPSWRFHEIHAANPQLHFKIAPVPQLAGGNKAAWASFWAFGVSNRSANQAEAWKFLKYLSSAEAEKSVYQEAAKIRYFGEPYSRADLQAELAGDPFVGAYVNQGPYYHSWYLASKTFDQGLDDQTIKYYEDAINATLQGNDPLAALQTTAQGIQKDILPKYILPNPSASPK